MDPHPCAQPDALPRRTCARPIGRVALLELTPPVLARALPFSHPVRTLDALHLASMEFLRMQGQTLQLASYDERLLAVARDLKISILEL